MITITRVYRFSASHRLHLKELSEDENSLLYGKCNNPFGHGHDYVLEVTAVGPVDFNTGLILSLDQLDRLVQDEVLAGFQHRNINEDVPAFETIVPTTENILWAVTDLIRTHWSSYVSGPASLFRVHIQETARNAFELSLRSPLPAFPNRAFAAHEEGREVLMHD